MQSDLSNPNITLTYGAWFSPTQEAFPFYLLVKTFYDGKFNELKNAEEMLFKAIAEVKDVTSETVMRNGKLFENSKLQKGEGD